MGNMKVKSNEKMNTPTHLLTIGTMIKRVRESKGMSQQQLADAAAMGRTQITDIESGRENFTINTLVRITTALGCILDVIMIPKR